jgi:hypothetical protein
MMQDIILLEADTEASDPSWVSAILDIHRKSGNSFSLFSRLDPKGRPLEQTIKTMHFNHKAECDVSVPDVSVMVFSRSSLEVLGGFSLRLFGYGCEKLDYLVRAKMAGVKGGYLTPELLSDFFEKKLRPTGHSHLIAPVRDVHYRDMRSLANLMTWTQQGFMPLHQPLWDPAGFDAIKTLKIYRNI